MHRQLSSAFHSDCHPHRNSGLTEQRNILHSQLSSCQEQAAALRAELQLYQKLVRDSAGDSGDPESSSRRLQQLLDEVKRLREQLQRGVRNNDALAEQLRSKLDLQSEREEEDGGSSHSSGSRVDEEEERETRRRQPRVTISGSRPLVTATTAAEPSSSAAGAIPRSTHLTAPAPEARVPLGGGLGTLTVRADVKMTSDGSATSLPQLSLSGKTPLREDPSLHLSAPRSHSSPFVKGAGLHTSSHAPSTSARFVPRTGEEDRRPGTRDAPTHTPATETGRHSLSDYLAREGIPKLEPAVYPSASVFLPATSRGRGSAPHSSTAARETSHPHPPPFSTSHPPPLSTSHPPPLSTSHPPPLSTSHPPPLSTSHPPPLSTSTPHPSTDGRRRRRDFESFESRLKQALESSQVRHSSPHTSTYCHIHTV